MEPVENQASEQDGPNFALPPLLDLTAAEPLCRSLQERLLGVDELIVNGSEVERVSTASIQVLLAAAHEAHARGIAFHLATPSETLVNALNDLGLTANFAV